MKRCLVLLGLLLACNAPVFGAEPKNILLIVADDLGMQVGCYGDKHAKTPNIDALAASGTRFTNAFASVASCSPSRATLLTGLPTHMSGQYGLAHATHNAYSFRNVKGLPALLAPHGYRTGVVSKLHVQPKEVYPFDAEIPCGRNPVVIAENAKKFITDSAGKPFFLLVGFQDPHRAAKGFANDAKYPASVPTVKFDPKSLPVPYHLPDQPEVRAELAEYYQSIARLDHGVGLLQKVLTETKCAENTLVIFLSDNGIPFPGAKTTLYDSGLHLPLIVHHPGQKGGQTCDAMVSWTDITPTILDYATAKKPGQQPGRSVLPLLQNPTAAGWDVVYGSHQFHEITMYYPMRMVRTRTHKLIVNYGHQLEYPHASDLWESPTWQGILIRNDTLMGTRSVQSFLNRPKIELYDVSTDPHELKNLAEEAGLSATRNDLREKLRDWQKKTIDPWLIKERHQ